MKRLRGFTILIAGLFVASLLYTLVASSVKVAANISQSDFESGSIFEPQYRKFTTEEINLYKTMIGVRDPDVNYNVIIDGHGTGFAPPSSDEWDRIAQESNVLDGASVRSVGLAPSFDLSENPTFPKVGNQGYQGSCAAWAATYYTYGYLEATDNDWTSAKSGNPSQLVSPAWTYNKVNGGADRGSWMGDNMRIIQDWGVPTLATMPYKDNDPVSWGSQSAFREAPLHRGSEVRYISGTSMGLLNAIKAVIVNGTPITFAIDAGQYNRGFSDGNYILTANEYISWNLNHANTIVGWNDSITDDGEVGAFRIVNSWGGGWADKGFYWLTFAALQEIATKGLLYLTYMEDITDYVPSMLAVWHFNIAPMRSTEPRLGLGDPLIPIKVKVPYFERDYINRFPTFMVLDISEFLLDYYSGNNSFFLTIGTTSQIGTISSFKVELYETGYIPGVATQATGQSLDIPISNPGTVTNVLDYYVPIPKGKAVNQDGLWFNSSTMVEWVGVNHLSNFGDSSIQSGDVGDSGRTNLRTEISGPCAFWFDWKVSSETGTDYLNFYIDRVVIASISGEVDWETMKYSLPPGPHILEWEYIKDSITSDGMDTAWIDHFVIDSSPPATSIDLSGENGLNGWYLGPVTVTLTATDGGGTGVMYTEYRIDGGSWVNYTSDFIVNGDGIHRIEYYSVDFAGHSEAASETEVSIDTVIPNTNMNLNGVLGMNGWYITPVNVTMFANDATSGVNWTIFRLNGGEWQYYDQNFPIDADGIYDFEFMSQDNAGNMEPVHSMRIKLDSSGPQTICNSYGVMGENGWFVSEVDVGIVASDEWSGVAWTKYRINQGIWKFYTGNITLIADGVYNVQFQSKDEAGLEEVVHETKIMIDKTAPTLTIDQTSGLKLTRNYLTLSWMASDEMSGLDRILTKLDGQAYVEHDPSEISIRLTGLQDGAHVFTVVAYDKAGSPTMKSIDFLVDGTPPVTSASHLGVYGRGQWYVSMVKVNLTAYDLTTSVKDTFYSINGADWQRYGEPFSVLDNGIIIVEFYSVDELGNAENVKSIELNIDFFAPELWLRYTSVHKNVTVVTIVWHTADYESGLDYCEVSFDGYPFIPAETLTSIVQYLPEGRHTYIIRAIDKAGNSIEKEYSLLVTKTTTTTFGVETVTGLTVDLLLLAIIVVWTSLIIVVLAIAIKSRTSRKRKTLSSSDVREKLL